MTRARKKVFRKLQAFEKKFPSRQGMIHADLHFGNLIFKRKFVFPIDFDDCGWGFYAYDLAIPWMSIENWLSKTQKKNLPLFRQELLRGYQAEKSWDEHDQAIFLISSKLVSF